MTSYRLLGLALTTTAGLACHVTTAAAEDTPAGWLHRPTASELLVVYPRDALRGGKSGKAVIACAVSVQGALHACTVVDESPPGLGFGAAAIALTPQMLMRPATHDGVAVESSIRMPIDFRNDRNGADPPTGSHLPNGGGAQPGSGLPRYADDPIVSRVRWVGAPTYAQVTAAYPEKARLARASGHVALNCPILRTRRLGHCDVISEFPRGLGFGGAAQALAADFVAPGAESGAGAGRLVGAHTQIAFTFAAEMLDNTTHIVGKPEWSRLPEALDVAQGFPAAATAAHIATGHIVLSCAIESGGILSDCMVEKQTPDGLGFGDAALALSTRFQVSVWTDEGLPTVGGRVRVPIRYDADSASSPPPPADLTLETAKITGLRRPLAPPPTTGPAKPASGALRYYPEHAQMAGVTGDTTLRCRIRAATLTLGDCRVIAETPTGEGFGDKSIALVDFGVRLQPRMLDRLKAAGKTPDGASAEVSFQFRLRDGDATPSP